MLQIRPHTGLKYRYVKLIVRLFDDNILSVICESRVLYNNCRLCLTAEIAIQVFTLLSHRVILRGSTLRCIASFGIYLYPSQEKFQIIQVPHTVITGDKNISLNRIFLRIFSISSHHFLILKTRTNSSPGCSSGS